MRVPDKIIVRHKDGTPCPEASRPYEGSCSLVGTGDPAHYGFQFGVATVSDEDIRQHFLGPIDIAHLTTTGEIRRLGPTHNDRLVITEVTVTAEIVRVP